MVKSTLLPSIYLFLQYQTNTQCQSKTAKQRYVVLICFVPMSHRPIIICKDKSSNILTMISLSSILLTHCCFSLNMHSVIHKILTTSPQKSSVINWGKQDELRIQLTPKVTSITTCLQTGGISHSAFKHRSLSKKDAGKELSIDQSRLSFRKHFFPLSFWKIP